MDVLRLVVRYLLTRRIALVALLSVTVAVAAMIVVASVMDGFQARIRGHIRGTNADLTVRVEGPAPHDHESRIREELRGELASAGGPIAALSPRLVSIALVASRIEDAIRGDGEDRYLGVQLIGVDWQSEREVVPLDRIVNAVKIPYRQLRRPPTHDPLKRAVPGILVGLPLAADLGVGSTKAFGLATEVMLVTGRIQRGERGDPDFDASNDRFVVAGCFDSGRRAYDTKHVYVSREAFRKLRYGGDPARPDATEVAIRLVDGSDLDAVVAGLESRHAGFVFESWKDRNVKLLDAIKVEKRVMVLVLGFIVVVSVSMVLGLLYMMVLEKTRDIGILRSMGMSRGRIVTVFMSYGMCLGCLGAILGVVLGLEVVWNLGSITDWLADTLGFEVFSRELYRFQQIPAVVDDAQIAWIAVTTALLTFVSGAVAAWKAAQLDPVACLKYE